jgi:hypothetical protein
MAKRTGKEILFHGGELSSEFFAGASFFTDRLHQAAEYADEGMVWAVLIDWAAESVEVEDADLYDGLDGDARWDEQTRQIMAAAAASDTVLACDDGLAIINAARLNPVLVSVQQAELMVDAIDYDEATPEEAFALR